MKKSLSINQINILNDLNRGLSIKEIASKKQVSLSAIYKSLRKIKLKEKKSNNYIKLKIKGKNQSEHRVVWESIYGKIPRDHIIHHIDFNKNNNSIDNLLCLTKHEHRLLHAHLKLKLKNLSESILKKIRSDELENE